MQEKEREEPNSAFGPPQSNCSILQRIDDEVSRLKCCQWEAVLHFGVDHVLRGETGPGLFLRNAICLSLQISFTKALLLNLIQWSILLLLAE
jgi:hypothetical protein